MSWPMCYNSMHNICKIIEKIQRLMKIKIHRLKSLGSIYNYLGYYYLDAVVR